MLTSGTSSYNEWKDTRCQHQVVNAINGKIQGVNFKLLMESYKITTYSSY
jgi:hypothetical protein